MSMPTVDDFVAAAEWVKARGWGIRTGDFVTEHLRLVCPLTALAWQRSNEDGPSIMSRKWEDDGGFLATVGLSDEEVEAFYSGFDGLVHLSRLYRSDTGRLGIAVYKALTARGLL